MNQDYIHSTNIIQKGGAKNNDNNDDTIIPNAGFPTIIGTIKKEKIEKKKEKVEEKGYQTKIDKLLLKNILQEKQQQPFFNFNDEVS